MDNASLCMTVSYPCHMVLQVGVHWAIDNSWILDLLL
jgi:hypothetical protein